MGIRNWKNAYTPAIPHMRLRRMQGSRSAFAQETEKASIASPIPSSMLLRKKEYPGFILSRCRKSLRMDNGQRKGSSR
jgi:hypothetical protein